MKSKRNRGPKPPEDPSGPYLVLGEPGTLPPPPGLSREGHIELRKPVTEARHERIAKAAAPTQKKGIKTVSEVSLPYSNYAKSGGWVKKGSSGKFESVPTWAGEKALRQKVLDAAQNYQTKAPIPHVVFSSAEPVAVVPVVMSRPNPNPHPVQPIFSHPPQRQTPVRAEAGNLIPSFTSSSQPDASS